MIGGLQWIRRKVPKPARFAIRHMLYSIRHPWRLLRSLGGGGSLRFVLLPIWHDLVASVPILHVDGYELSSPLSSQAITVRPRTSDIDVFRQIFVEQEYSVLDDVADVRTIIDCGANIGCSSRWFLETHPKARVVAVEPDPANVAQLKLNLAPFAARAIIIQGAVWSHTSSLIVVRGAFGDGREWATQVRECGASEVPDLNGHSMSDLFSMFEEPTIDILKIDIEGAEEQLFGCGELSWVSRLRAAVIEIHSNVNKDLIYRAFPEGVYTRVRCGELTGFKKLPTD